MGHHSASHAARKGIKGSPHTKGMPSNYLAGHTEDHLNAHNTHAGKLMKTTDNLSKHLATGGENFHEHEGVGRATEDEENDV